MSIRGLGVELQTQKCRQIRNIDRTSRELVLKTDKDVQTFSDHSTTDDDDDDDDAGDETNDETAQGPAVNVSIVPIDLGPTDVSNIR